MKKLNNKGFSLVEILAAICILAILMMVATQAYNTYKKQARQQAYDTMAKSTTVAATNYLMENSKSKYIKFETLKELQYLDTLQDPRYKDKECSGIVINKVMPGETQKQLDVLFQKVKLCCKNYKYQYDYTGEEVKVTEIDSCEYIEGDEIDGVYKLIYKTQGGTNCDPSVVIKNQHEEWGPLCETTKEKNVFKGWNTKKNGSGSTITEHTKVGDKDINAYAIWNPIYTLTFDELGGTTCNIKTITKENGEQWGTLCETSKTGYAFKGWNTKKDGTGTKITNNTTASKNLTAYAHWNPYYTLTFNSNNGSECSPNTITKEKGEEWGTLCTPTRTNYAFIEWNTKKDGTGTKVTSKSEVKNDITVYAIWNPKYTLTFDSNNGNECNPKTINQEKGKEWGTLCTTKRTGYNFVGWFDGDLEVTSSTKASSSVVVKAKWNPKKYTITYDNNNGEGCNTKNGNYDQPWGDLCVPTRKGYTFAGWTKDGTAVTKDTICKANITVKANWTINSYTLTFDSNKGTDCSPKTITKEYNSKWGTLCATTRTGYKFGGWFNDDKEVTADSKATKTITVKAKWTANKYTLTYDDNGGTGCSDSSIKESYGNAWGTLCTPTKAGHTFVGWNTKKEGTGTTVTKSTTVGASNIKVFAQWTANACTLTYVDSKGTGCNNSTISTTYGNTWGTLCGPTRTHYTFAGWNTKSDGTGTNVSSTTSTTNVCDSNVYPKWTKNKYVLSYEGTGSEKCSSITKEYNSEWGTLCTPTTQTHYTFAGWFNGDTEVTNSSKATATITVTSRWNTKKYKLTYNSDGGTACSEKSVDYDTAWGTLCEPTKSGYTFKGWFNSSGTEVKSSTVCKGNESVTAKWAANSKAVTISSSGYGTSSTIYISLSATNPDTSQNISATATSGTATCSYSGSTINCTVKNVSNKTVTNDTDCTKWAQANGVSGTVKYLTNKEYNYSKWAKDATAGCYLQVSSSARTKDTWTCMYTAAKDSFFKGSESHCTKEACGYSDCLTRGYNDLGSGYRSCKCWRKVGNNITTYYDTTVTVTYYQYT